MYNMLNTDYFLENSGALWFIIEEFMAFIHIKDRNIKTTSLQPLTNPQARLNCHIYWLLHP